MLLLALSIGYAVPDGSFRASVHSAFQSALNLRVEGKDHLLTLVRSGEGDLPQGIRIDTPEGFSFSDFRLGDWVICMDGILRFKDHSLAVQLHGAQRWKCDLPTLAFDPRIAAVSAAWHFVWDTLNEQQILSEAGIVAEELFRESERADVPRRVGAAVRELVDATGQYDSTDAPVRALIGLGAGLTPSGDDLLVGYLAGLWCAVGDKNKRIEFIHNLGKTVARLSSQTNDISRTYLYHATRGQVSNRLADLAQAICRPEKPARLQEIAQAAFQTGHTSGMDAVTGLLIGMAAWTGVESLFR